MRTCAWREELKDKSDCDERFFTRSRGDVDAMNVSRKGRLAKKSERNYAFRKFSSSKREREREINYSIQKRFEDSFPIEVSHLDCVEFALNLLELAVFKHQTYFLSNGKFIRSICLILFLRT